jgi:hypothetical protein
MNRSGINARLRMFEDAYEYLRARTVAAAEATRNVQKGNRKARGIGRRITLPKPSF